METITETVTLDKHDLTNRADVCNLANTDEHMYHCHLIAGLEQTGELDEAHFVIAVDTLTIFGVVNEQGQVSVNSVWTEEEVRRCNHARGA